MPPAGTRPQGETAPRPCPSNRSGAICNALRAEGAVSRLAPCHQADVCAEVTELFRSLDTSDRRSIGRGTARYFETRLTDARPVREVRFLDIRTGIELGRYADGRLLWEGDF